jgi:hypothetical protein
MKSGYGLTVDGLFEPVPADLGLVSRHVPSLSDELGDRVLILDERGEPSLSFSVSQDADDVSRVRKSLSAGEQNGSGSSTTRRLCLPRLSSISERIEG